MYTMLYCNSHGILARVVTKSMLSQGERGVPEAVMMIGRDRDSDNVG